MKKHVAKAIDEKLVLHATRPGWVLRLLKQYGGRLVNFASLPSGAQSALRQYESEAINAQLSPMTSGLLPTTKVGFARISLDVLKHAVFTQLSMDEPGTFKNFDDYHKWFVREAPVPRHKTVWAIIADPYDDEILSDGWHRFHHYVRSGVQSVPVVWFVRRD